MPDGTAYAMIIKYTANQFTAETCINKQLSSTLKGRYVAKNGVISTQTDDGQRESFILRGFQFLRSTAPQTRFQILYAVNW